MTTTQGAAESKWVDSGKLKVGRMVGDSVLGVNRIWWRKQLRLISLRLKVLSDLLISVSKDERKEARMKVRQDSLRLGNVGVIRAGTVISETWEDGQAIKDLNVHLRQLLEMKEAVERQRKLLKKRQSERRGR